MAADEDSRFWDILGSKGLGLSGFHTEEFLLLQTLCLDSKSMCDKFPFAPFTDVGHSTTYCWGLYEEFILPLTTISIIFVSSYFKTLYRNSRQPTKKMAWTVEGM